MIAQTIFAIQVLTHQCNSFNLTTQCPVLQVRESQMSWLKKGVLPNFPRISCLLVVLQLIYISRSWDPPWKENPFLDVSLSSLKKLNKWLKLSLIPTLTCCHYTKMWSTIIMALSKMQLSLLLQSLEGVCDLLQWNALWRSCIFFCRKVFISHSKSCVKQYTELYIKCITNFRINKWHLQSHSSQSYFLFMTSRSDILYRLYHLNRFLTIPFINLHGGQLFQILCTKIRPRELLKCFMDWTQP